jgi:ectoine hydroxylase-related dioxygenase (phytanoyl-CoA dioxygenase family)
VNEHIRPLPRIGLPPIRDDLEAAKADLDAIGFTRIRGTKSDEHLARIRDRLEEQAAGERAHGKAFFLEGPNQRVWNLANKGEVFRDWACDPDVSALVEHMLGPDYLLFSLTANIAGKGGEKMFLHGDQQFSKIDTLPVVANSILMLVDFTAENGATMIVPGSHDIGRWPKPENDADAIPAIGPAGTVLVYDGRLWHGTGANRTDALRPAILTAYSRPYIRTQENHSLSIAPEVYDACSPRMLTLLGFETSRSGGALGMVNGTMPGQMNRRPTEFVTELKP